MKRLLSLGIVVLLLVLGTGCGGSGSSDSSGNVGTDSGYSYEDTSQGGETEEGSQEELVGRVKQKANELLSVLESELRSDQNTSELFEEVRKYIESYSSSNNLATRSGSTEERYVLSPEDACDLYHEIGVLFALNYKTKMAEYLFAKAVECDPEDTLYNAELVATMIVRGEENLAGSFVDYLDSVGSEYPQANLTMATYHSIKGEEEKAISYAANAVVLDPDAPIFREFFFGFLAEKYPDFADEMLQVRKDVYNECTDVLQRVMDVESPMEAMDLSLSYFPPFVSAHIEEMQSAIESLDDMMVHEIEAMRENTAYASFENWEREINGTQERIDEHSEWASERLQSCWDGCGGDAGCLLCACPEQFLYDELSFANEEVYPEVDRILKKYVPESFYNLRYFESGMLNYIAKNGAGDDFGTLWNLLKYTYSIYGVSCLTNAQLILNTQMLYDNYQTIRDGITIDPSVCQEPEYSLNEVDKEEVEKESDLTSNDIDDYLRDLKFEICTPGVGPMGICTGYDRGVFTLTVNSGLVSTSMGTDFQENGRRMGGIGLGVAKGFEGVNLISFGMGVKVEKEGNLLKAVSIDGDVKTFANMRKEKKVSIFVYKVRN
jgi:hypothetical protein